MKTIIKYLFLMFGVVFAEEFPIQDVLDMNARDLQLRQEWLESKDENIAKKLRFQEIGNSTFLREIIVKYGIPQDTENNELNNAILQLVLHSTDLDFQKKVLDLLDPKTNVNMYPILTDRILLKETGKQKYGTHLYHMKDQLVPYPLIDPENINTLRKTVGETDLEKYLTLIENIDLSFQNNEISDLYKIVFNLRNHFYKDPEQFFYYATFQNEALPPIENGKYLAFKDPSLAIAFALLKNTPLNGDFCYENNELFVSLSPQSLDDALILAKTPVYIHLVDRDTFSLNEDYNPQLSNRVYTSENHPLLVTSFPETPILETMILTGTKIEICNSENSSIYRDSAIYQRMKMFLFFDITLENEP